MHDNGSRDVVVGPRPLSLQIGILSHQAFILGSDARDCVMGGLHTNAVHTECLGYFSIGDLSVAYC